MKRPTLRLLFLMGLALAPRIGRAADDAKSFAIEIVDDQTGRGVPMVELQTTSGARYYTDSNGLVAFFEPGLMGQKVYFAIAAHGYEYPADGLGLRGAALVAKPGGSATLKIKRINIAERLYRITGQGIYRDTVLLDRRAPIDHPLLDAQVTGQDSVLAAVYKNRTFFLFGDTNRLSYGLGNFSTSGATAPPPDQIDPEKGVNLTYFMDRNGFSRKMAPMKGPGVVWLSALVVVPDESGQDHLLAYFQRRRGLGAVLDEGFVEYDDEHEVFKKVHSVKINPPYAPTGHSLRVEQKGTTYLYFTAPYPALRVRADRASYIDLSAYEGYTCLKPGSHPSGKGKGQLEVERDEHGHLVWGWKKGMPPLTPKNQQALIRAGKMKRAESPFRLQDADTGKAVHLHNGSVAWNEYRKKYVMIASEVFGATMLGETWYAESDHPEGPWSDARKIITHANKKDDAHDFYNPTQHPFLDRDGGRLIYLEGTYVNTFSGNKHPTPYYEYNQIMYRLDLSDPRLRLPEKRGGR